MSEPKCGICGGALPCPVCESLAVGEVYARDTPKQPRHKLSPEAQRDLEWARRRRARK